MMLNRLVLKLIFFNNFFRDKILLGDNNARDSRSRNS